MAPGWGLNSYGGGKPLKCGGVYSFDNKHYIQPFNNLLRVYFISTRQCIKTIYQLDLEFVVAVNIDPVQPNLVWLFTRTGGVTIVNWKDRVAEAVVYQNEQWRKDSSLIEVIDFRFNFSLGSYEIIALDGKLSNKNGHKRTVSKIVCLVAKGQDHVTLGLVEVEELVVIRDVIISSKSLNCKNVVFLTKTNEDGKEANFALEVVELRSFNVNKQQKIDLKSVSKQSSMHVTALAVSNVGLIAAGYRSGVVEVMYDFGASESKVMKWHIDAVGALSFTKENNYLISGGREKVLVFWQIESDKLQFLPRLNGPIEAIGTNYVSPDIDSTVSQNETDYYTVQLAVGDNGELEYLVLNSLELTSRLAIGSLRLSTGRSLGGLVKEAKRLELGTEAVYKVKHAYSSALEINSVDKCLYLLGGSEIQCYSLVKDQQLYSLNVIPKVQIGKVKSEVNIVDPRVGLMKFTCDGRWLVTFDEYETPKIDRIVSENDVKYSLKFWSYNEAGDGSSRWELASKIVDPHGANVRIVAVLPAPAAYYGGHAFVTVDSTGGVRLWRPQEAKKKSQPWSLRKLIGSLTSKPVVDVTSQWSQDGSLLIIGLNNVLFKVPVSNFDSWGYLLADARLVNSKSIKALKLVNDDKHLVVVSDEYLVNYDIINNRIKYQYKLAASKWQFDEKLISHDDLNDKLVVGLNYFDAKGKASSVVVAFDFASDLPITKLSWSSCLVSVAWIPGTEHFVFVDVDYKVGVLGPNISGSSKLQDVLVGAAADSSVEFTDEIASLVQTTKKLTVQPSTNGTNGTEDGFWYGKTIGTHTFDKVFQKNLEGIAMEDLFEAVIECI